MDQRMRRSGGGEEDVEQKMQGMGGGGVGQWMEGKYEGMWVRG